MPVTRSSALDFKAATDLAPGESGLRLKDDPYYGKVDLGAGGDDKDTKAADDFEKKERARIDKLPADERPEAEQKLLKELAKKRLASGAKSGAGDFDPNEPLTMPPSGTTPEKLAQLDVLQASIEGGAHVLDGEEQSHVEVLTGKRLQQKPAADHLSPRKPEDATEGVEGTEGERVTSKGSALEPPERDRDKTKAAKPGESAKS